MTNLIDRIVNKINEIKDSLSLQIQNTENQYKIETQKTSFLQNENEYLMEKEKECTHTNNK